MTDVREQSTRWPEFSATATRVNVAGVAGIPMRLDDQIIGALSLYSAEPRRIRSEPRRRPKDTGRGLSPVFRSSVKDQVTPLR